MKDILKVYIAGPYTASDKATVEENVAKAVEVAEAVADMGLVPFIPHLYHFWDAVFPHEYLFWFVQDIPWLLCCDAILMYKPSPGAREEVQVAVKNHIPVFHSLDDLKREVQRQLNAAVEAVRIYPSEDPTK